MNLNFESDYAKNLLLNKKHLFVTSDKLNQIDKDISIFKEQRLFSNKPQHFARKKCTDDPTSNSNQPCIKQLTDIHIDSSFKNSRECSNKIISPKPPCLETAATEPNNVCCELKVDACNKTVPEPEIDPICRSATDTLGCKPLNPAFEDHRDVFKKTMTCREIVNCCAKTKGSTARDGPGSASGPLSAASKSLSGSGCGGGGGGGAKKPKKSTKYSRNCGSSNDASNKQRAACKRVICPEKCGHKKNPFEQNRMASSNACQRIEIKQQEIKRERCSFSSALKPSPPPSSQLPDRQPPHGSSHLKCPLLVDQEPFKANDVCTCPDTKRGSGCLQKIFNFFQRKPL